MTGMIIFYLGRSKQIFKLELYQLFAEENHMTIKEAKEVATPYELFNTFLEYEGIIGYTDKIITTFRECFNID